MYRNHMQSIRYSITFIKETLNAAMVGFGSYAQAVTSSSRETKV